MFWIDTLPTRFNKPFVSGEPLPKLIRVAARPATSHGDCNARGTTGGTPASDRVTIVQRKTNTAALLAARATSCKIPLNEHTVQVTGVTR